MVPLEDWESRFGALAAEGPPSRDGPQERLLHYVERVLGAAREPQGRGVQRSRKGKRRRLEVVAAALVGHTLSHAQERCLSGDYSRARIVLPGNYRHPFGVSRGGTLRREVKA